ncbi:MAG: hypothetical protein AAGE52_24365 [Myxococcota bacterium]
MVGLADRALRTSLVLTLLVACGDGSPAAQPSADPEDPVAEVRETEGDVRWQSLGAAWLPADVGQVLSEGDAVQTMEEATTLLRFWSDGAHLRLEPETTLRVSALQESTARVEQRAGRLVARLEAGAPRRMEVAVPPGTLVLTRESPDETVEAHLNVQDSETDIEMLAGEGRFEPATGAPIAIAESHYLVVQEDGALMEEGTIGDPVVVTSPEPDAEIATRTQVEFAWEAHPEAEGYVLSLRSEERERAVEVTTTEAAVEVPSGRYEWRVRAVRGESQFRWSEARPITVRFDRTPPRLSVSAPAPGAQIRGGSLVVRGRTEAGAVVTVDGRPATVAADGTFRARHSIARGLANIVVEARDDLGNRRVVLRQVTRR